MVSIPKLDVVLSCGCLLHLALSTAIQAAEKSHAAVGTEPQLSVSRNGDRLTPDEATAQGINTVKGEVLRINRDHLYVRKSDGKEVHLHAKPTTEMVGEFTKGDRIEVKMDDQNNALSMRLAK